MTYLLDGQETSRLLFRLISPDDFDDWLEFFKDPETSRHWKSEKEDAAVTCRKWYEKQLERYASNDGGMNALVEKTSGMLVGHCGLLKQKVDDMAELEIAYSLLPAFRNKGYATEAALQCRDWAFSNNLSPSLISIISLTNKPSEKVALKVGMLLDKQTVYKNNAVNIFRIWNKG
ncbi:GNAT family N-acetyltransferase [Parafilimonas sp.]|uniref:GNAT family N-acetyltransferase n=1 Tax=Parafilimonas sp. TaxID=1969739 RepID=UPI0039E46765